jgi:hypothetical protein
MPADDAYRRAHLLWAVQHVLTQSRGRVGMQGPYDAIVEGAGMQHVLHIVLTVFTGGIWLLVWAITAARFRRAIYRITVDADGQLAIFEASRHVPCSLSPSGILSHGR